jgi:hypothetical protein
MALDSASVETRDADLDARLRSPEGFDVRRHRWWTLRSESLEVLPSGTWRVMASLTDNGTHALMELRFEIDPEASGHDWLVLRGRGVLDRRAFGMGKRASFLGPTTQLDLTARARQVETSDTESQDQEKVTCTTSMPAESAAGRPNEGGWPAARTSSGPRIRTSMPSPSRRHATPGQRERTAGRSRRFSRRSRVLQPSPAA